MLTPGAIVQNRYQVIRLLGQGGFGAVYQARDMRLGQIVALKENTGGDPRQFQQEALILANLRHSNLPRVSDHFVEPNGAQYLVMDFVEGEDLESVLQRQGALSEAQVLAWFDQILDAVAYLHGHNIIHRDIKPANIKITPAGQAVLVDFGIAKVFQPGQFTVSGAKAASPGFSAPEQYRGGTDQRSDIYSLGATLYALLTGSDPPDARALERGTATLTPPRALNPAMSIACGQNILQAMTIQASQRFQSVDEMRHVLQNMRMLPTISTPGFPKPHPQLGSRTKQRVAQILGLVAILCVLASLAGSILWWDIYRTDQRAALERQVTELVNDSIKSLEESKRLERTDKTAARGEAQKALTLAEQARALSPQDPRASSAYYAAQDSLDALNGVSVIFALPTFATFTDPKSQLTRIVVHWPDLFMLDRGLQRVYRFTINDVGSNAASASGDGIILKFGDKIENRAVGEIFDLLWLDAGRLVALDRAGAYYQYDPARAAWSARVVNDPAAWTRATLAEIYTNNLYLVDAPRNQILKYVTPSAEVVWSSSVTYFSPGVTPPDLSTAVDLAIDGDVWILRGDGSVSRCNQGRPNDIALAGLDTPISKPSAIVTSEKMSNLYIADAGNQRIVQFDKGTGRFTRQFKPRGQDRDAFKALQVLAVDEANKHFFFVSENKAYIATIPQ